MRIFDDPDDVFATLRLPATEEELARESEVVDRMVSAHHSTKEPPMITVPRPSGRRARIATLVAAGVLGFGGVAAAGPGGLDPLGLEAGDDSTEVDESAPETTAGDEESPETTADEEATTDETETEETEEAAAEDGTEEELPVVAVPQADAENALAEPSDGDEEPEDPDKETDFNEAYCLPGNHGKTVSAVARREAPFDDPKFDDLEVRDAARSSCGKQGDADEVDESETPEEPEGVESIEAESDDERSGPPADRGNAGKQAEQDEPGRPGKPDHAGKGNGKGKGRG